MSPELEFFFQMLDEMDSKECDFRLRTAQGRNSSRPDRHKPSFSCGEHARRTARSRARCAIRWRRPSRYARRNVLEQPDDNHRPCSQGPRARHLSGAGICRGWRSRFIWSQCTGAFPSSCRLRRPHSPRVLVLASFRLALQSKFDFVINLRTAHVLGMTPSAEFISAAAEVIE
jgi:hypothetical protein